MLVLSRREEERITIIAPDGTEIEIAILQNRNSVRVGIEAPENWTVVRTELLEPNNRNKDEQIFCRWQTCTKR